MNKQYRCCACEKVFINPDDWTCDCGCVLEIDVEYYVNRVAELEAELNNWHDAWVHDCIGPTANGNTCQGLDEGVVMSCRMMKPILEKTRVLLGKPEEAEWNGNLAH